MKTNAKRSLETIAAELRDAQRKDLFTIGALLVEAHEACEPGRWMEWQEENFEGSHDSARNYMAVHRLVTHYEHVRNLRVPARVIYSLAIDLKDDPGLPTVIGALIQATKDKTAISVAEAEHVIEVALLRIEHGDFPDATLKALDMVSSTTWAPGATEALKAERPTTAEAAERVTGAAHRAYVTDLYAPLGKLPDDVSDDSLWDLAQVPEEDRGAVLQKLQDAPRPLTDEAVGDCIIGDAGDKGNEAEKKAAAARLAKEAADRAAERAAEEAARQAAAAKAQQQMGANSPAEIERKLARLEELEAKTSMLERVKLAQESEIEDLKKTAQAAKPPVRPSLVEALETALELAREAARHDGGLSSGKAKKRERALTEIRSALALLIQLEQETPAQRAA